MPSPVGEIDHHEKYRFKRAQRPGEKASVRVALRNGRHGDDDHGGRHRLDLAFVPRNVPGGAVPAEDRAECNNILASEVISIFVPKALKQVAWGHF